MKKCGQEMNDIEEENESSSSENGKTLDAFAVDTTEESDGFCPPVVENSCTKRRSTYEDSDGDNEELVEEEPASYFSVPTFILDEKIDGSDSTVFFDTCPSQIKDFPVRSGAWHTVSLFCSFNTTMFCNYQISIGFVSYFAGFRSQVSIVGQFQNELTKTGFIYAKELFAWFQTMEMRLGYSLHIAQHEYVFENSLAFFPFYPMTIRILSMAWATPFVHFGFIHVSSALLISAVAINLGCFLIAAVLLYRIVLRVSRSVKQAVIAVLIFSANPASIFFSAAYTESLYCMLTFAGICVLLEDRPSFFIRYLGSLLCFGLAYATRSNGLINIGYVGFFCLIDFLLNVDHEHPRRRRVILRRPITVIISRATAFIMRMILAVLSIALPIFVHGRRQQIAFCSQSSASSVPSTLQRFATEHQLVTVGRTDVIDWCKSLWHLLAEGGDHVPYTLHAMFMALGALFVYNAEVLTRMLFSSSPFPYLVLARWISDITPQVRLSDLFVPQPLPFLTYFCRRGLPEFLLYLYLMVYLIFGTTMHAMWLPFT
ncbi:mannosyltransferase [Cooperia oncophora]